MSVSCATTSSSLRRRVLKDLRVAPSHQEKRAVPPQQTWLCMTLGAVGALLVAVFAAVGIIIIALFYRKRGEFDIAVLPSLADGCW